jgi:NitT/TauT family transport system permease protein
VLGFVFGTLVGMTTLARRVLYPYIVAFQAIPKVAFIPLFMTWFGFGATSKIAIASTIAFFPVFINTMAGVASSPDEGNRLMYSLGASRLQQFRMFQFPSALPSIIAGVNIALTFAVVGVIVAEFEGAQLGLGYLIEVFSFQLKISQSLAVVMLLSILAFVLYYGLDKLSKHFVFWINWQDKTRVPIETGKENENNSTC